MPTVTPDSPGEFVGFPSEFEHVRAHRGLEAAVESINVTSGTGSFTTTSTDILVATTATIAQGNLTTTSTQALLATRVGFGGATPGTASTAAQVTGFYRTATAVQKAILWTQTNSMSVVTFSVETQVGNPISPGTPIILLPDGGTLPTNAVMTAPLVTATNTIRVAFYGVDGGINTTTVSWRVFSIDID